MTSKIKVDNIENQCGGAVVTKCGGTTTITGTNVVGSTAVKSNAIQASDGGNLVSQSGTTITLGASGDTIALASGASQTGFGRTGTVDWQTTPKTATFTAVSGEGYFANTSGSAFNMNLPAGVAGAIVSVADYAATFQTNNLTVVPNGTDKIGSLNENAILGTEGQSVTLVYVDGTQGWINTMDSTSNVRGSPPKIVATGGTITTCGNDKIHTFTGPGTFTVCSVSCCASFNTVAYTVVAGGGSGSSANNNNNGSGAGGAGGFREGRTSSIVSYSASPLAAPTGITVTATGFPITVGAGGAAVGSGIVTGNSGNNSVFSTITSAAGGRGGNGPGSCAVGGTGGSGGGGASAAGGSGNTPPVSPPQGQNGGAGFGVSGPAYGGGGGGGAGAAGTTGTGPQAGPGGAGVSTSIPGGSIDLAGGGGAGSYSSGSAGLGGPGGGGAGGNGTGTAVAGTANKGGGGGANNNPSGTSGAGGSGVVILRYRFK